MQNNNFSQQQIDQFDNLSNTWWDINGPLRTLHHINPSRIQFVKNNFSLKNKTILDVGCGGGIFSESLAKEGAIVDAIDLSEQSIKTAKEHMQINGLNINYECISLEEKLKHKENYYDCICAMDIIEHIPYPDSFITIFSKLLKPEGYLFISTINRNIKSYLFAILIGEYITNLIPKGTHKYENFLKPSELNAMFNNNNLKLVNLQGIEYNPFTKDSKISNNIDINYIICSIKRCIL